MLGDDLRPDIHDADIRWQGLFEIGKHFGPADALPVEQRVEKETALENFGIFRALQYATEARLLGIGPGELLVEALNHAAGVGGSAAVGQSERTEQHQHGHEQYADGAGSHQDGPIFARWLRGEIDWKFHAHDCRDCKYPSRPRLFSPGTPAPARTRSTGTRSSCANTSRASAPKRTKPASSTFSALAERLSSMYTSVG